MPPPLPLQHTRRVVVSVAAECTILPVTPDWHWTRLLDLIQGAYVSLVCPWPALARHIRSGPVVLRQAGFCKILCTIHVHVALPTKP